MEKLTWHTEQKKINDLIQFEGNPRNMTEKQNEDLKKSLEKFNLVEIPAIDTDNVIIAGHQRLRVLQLLNRGDEVIDVRMPNRKLTSEEFQEYNIRSNKNLGEWDYDLLANFDEELLKEVGWDSKDLDNIFGLEPDEKDDEVPELPKEPKSKLGEIYQLGNHRIMCGDSTKEEDVEKLMDGNNADMVFTDPPYGINAVSHSGVLKKRYKIDIKNDDNVDVAIMAYELCKDIKYQVWWGANYYSSVLPNATCWIVWDKNNGESDQMDCELAYTNFKGVTRQHTQSSEKINRIHPTQKPVSLFEWTIRRFKLEPMIVLDLFLGSGSTLIACEKTKRVCYGMEIDPKYIDVIIERWEQYTGEKSKQIK